ncbi:hypothetical protein GDO86_015664 [Hymenochirus boettgeri]|uniref:Mediator of DNA damage checkpoint protein 1 n=1 Tax=Hymenochirus boettgeri TaxID=247094 RepID=A0A8T2K1Z1_9PIPI|nr:hypothetical protein GDO86_015664 [Hymenochirus boettgeri]
MDNTQPLELVEEEHDPSADRTRPVGTLHLFKGNYGPAQDFTIYPGKNLIGRHASCDVILPAQSVSKQHAILEVHSDCHTLCDQGSLNKTRRGKAALTPHVRYALSDGDLLLFADVACQYTIETEGTSKEMDTSIGEIENEESEDDILVPGTQCALAIEKTPGVAIRRLGRGAVLAVDSGDENEDDFKYKCEDFNLVGEESKSPTSAFSTHTFVPESDEENDTSVTEPQLPSLNLRCDSDTDAHDTSIRIGTILNSTQDYIMSQSLKEQLYFRKSEQLENTKCNPTINKEEFSSRHLNADVTTLKLFHQDITFKNNSKGEREGADPGVKERISDATVKEHSVNTANVQNSLLKETPQSNSDRDSEEKQKATIESADIILEGYMQNRKRAVFQMNSDTDTEESSTATSKRNLHTMQKSKDTTKMQNKGGEVICLDSDTDIEDENCVHVNTDKTNAGKHQDSNTDVDVNIQMEEKISTFLHSDTGIEKDDKGMTLNTVTKKQENADSDTDLEDTGGVFKRVTKKEETVHINLSQVGNYASNDINMEITESAKPPERLTEENKEEIKVINEFQLNSDTDVEEDENAVETSNATREKKEDHNINGNEKKDQMVTVGDKKYDEEINFDSDTDVDEKEMDNQIEANQKGEAALTMDTDRKVAAALTMDCDTDVDEKEMDNEIEADRKGEAALTMDSDTDVDEKEMDNETEADRKVGAALTMDSDTDVDEKEMDNETEADRKREAALTMDSDTDVDEKEMDNEIEADRKGEAALTMDRVDREVRDLGASNTTEGGEGGGGSIEDKEACAVYDMATQCYLEPQEKESDIEDELNCAEEATQAFVFSSTWTEPNPFKRPADPVGVLQISAVTMNSSEEEMDENEIAETQPFCCEIEQREGDCVNVTDTQDSELKRDVAWTLTQGTISQDDTEPVSQYLKAGPSIAVCNSVSPAFVCPTDLNNKHDKDQTAGENTKRFDRNARNLEEDATQPHTQSLPTLDNSATQPSSLSKSVTDIGSVKFCNPAPVLPANVIKRCNTTDTLPDGNYVQNQIKIEVDTCSYIIEDTKDGARGNPSEEVCISKTEKTDRVLDTTNGAQEISKHSEEILEPPNTPEKETYEVLEKAIGIKQQKRSKGIDERKSISQTGSIIDAKGRRRNWTEIMPETGMSTTEVTKGKKVAKKSETGKKATETKMEDACNEEAGTTPETAISCFSTEVASTFFREPVLCETELTEEPVKRTVMEEIVEQPKDVITEHQGYSGTKENEHYSQSQSTAIKNVINMEKGIEVKKTSDEPVPSSKPAGSRKGRSKTQENKDLLGEKKEETEPSIREGSKGRRLRGHQEQDNAKRTILRRSRVKDDEEKKTDSRKEITSNKKKLELDNSLKEITSSSSTSLQLQNYDDVKELCASNTRTQNEKNRSLNRFETVEKETDKLDLVKIPLKQSLRKQRQNYKAGENREDHKEIKKTANKQNIKKKDLKVEGKVETKHNDVADSELERQNPENNLSDTIKEDTEKTMSRRKRNECPKDVTSEDNEKSKEDLDSEQDISTKKARAMQESDTTQDDASVEDSEKQGLFRKSRKTNKNVQRDKVKEKNDLGDTVRKECEDEAVMSKELLMVTKNKSIRNEDPGACELEASTTNISGRTRKNLRGVISEEKIEEKTGGKQNTRRTRNNSKKEDKMRNENKTEKSLSEKDSKAGITITGILNEQKEDTVMLSSPEKNKHSLEDSVTRNQEESLIAVTKDKLKMAPTTGRKRGQEPKSIRQEGKKQKMEKESMQQEEPLLHVSRRGRARPISENETTERIINTKNVTLPSPSSTGNTSLNSSKAFESPSAARTPRRTVRSLITSPYMPHQGISPKVLFTGVVDTAGEETIRSLGGDIAESIFDCTHLVTDRVRRTVKFLCALAKGIPIVTLDWIDKCRRSECFLSPSQFLVKDKEQEKNFNFVLSESLQKAKKKPLFEGFAIHVTSNVKPEPEHMKDIIQCSGATFLPKIPKVHKEKCIIVSCQEDAGCCKSTPSSIPITTAEFILTGILRQEVNPNAYLLCSRLVEASHTQAKRRR